MSFLTYAIAAKLERGTHLLDTLVSKQDIPKDQLERDLNTLHFNPSTLLKAELIERDFHKAVDVLFTKRLVARGNASYGVEIEGEERVIESLKLVHQATNDDIYQSGLRSLAHHLGSRKLIETTNAVVLGGDIELTDTEYEFEKPYTDETIASILDLAETEEKVASEKNVASEQVTSEQATSEQGVTSEQATSEQATSEQVTSEEATSEEATSEQVTSEQATSEEVISGQETSEQATSEQATSEQETSEQKTSEQETSEEATSEEVTSGQEPMALDVAKEPSVDALPEQIDELETHDVTMSETATEAATKSLPFTSEELEAYAKEIVERGNKLAKDAEQKGAPDFVNEVPDFGHSETSDVLAVLGDSADASVVVSEDTHASEQTVGDSNEADASTVVSEDTHASEEAEALNHMIDEISTDLKTSEKPVLDVTPSEGPSVDTVTKAFGGSLDGLSVVSNLGRLHDVGQPIASQFAR